jgi:hypothetical protein
MRIIAACSTERLDEARLATKEVAALEGEDRLPRLPDRNPGRVVTAELAGVVVAAAVAPAYRKRHEVRIGWAAIGVALVTICEAGAFCCARNSLRVKLPRL